MSSLLPFTSGSHPVWSPMANEIHAAIWDHVGLEKVQGFVREWASGWSAGLNAQEAARQQKFALARQALHSPDDSTLNLIADNLPDDWQLKEALWEPVPPDLPLPPSHRPRSLAEKWAALAAVHDVFDLSGDKVLPWPIPEDDQDLPALTEWMRGEGGSYLVLMRAAAALTDTEADPVGRWLEDLKNGGAPAANPSKAGSDGPNWQDVQAELERLRLKGERYTSQQKLADKVGCSKFLVQKAIANGPVELQEWASKEHGASRLNASPEVAVVAFENTPDGRETDPANILHDCDVDVVLGKLLDEASPEEQARIHGMTPAEKRQLAETVYRDRDAEEQALRQRRARLARRD